MNSPWQQQYKGRNWTADKRPKSKKKPSFFLFRVFSIAPWRLSWLHALLRSFIGLYFHYTRSHILFYGQAARHTHKKGGNWLAIMAFGGLLILSNRSPVMPRLLPDFPIKNLLAVNFFVTATVEVLNAASVFFPSKSLPFQMPVANSFLPYPLSKKGEKLC